MAHEQQARYSNLVDAKLRSTLVKKDGVIFNTRYEGNPTAGVVKIPVRDTEVTVSDYSKADGAGATHGDTAYVDLIIDKDKASIGMLQRMFKIGFNRAARIMDQLCEAGVVGEEEGTKPRTILMTPEQFENMREQEG